MYFLDTDKILMECARKKLSITEFLKKAKISYVTFRMLKRGSKANVKTLGKLAAALDVSPEELIIKED